MTKITDQIYSFSPSFVQMVEMKLFKSNTGLSINLTQDELETTYSHTQYINQMFIKMLEIVDKEKWSDFCAKYSTEISDVYDVETKVLKNSKTQESDYYKCIGQIDPIISKLEKPFFECINCIS